MKTETFDAIATVGGRTSGGGAVVGFFGWLMSSEAVGLLGVCIALLGALVSWYYKREASRRHAIESAARLKTEELRAQREQVRIDMMRATGRPLKVWDDDSDLAPLEADT